LKSVLLILLLCWVDSPVKSIFASEALR